MGKIVDGSFWLYAPVKGASIVFAVLFAISGVLHIWQNNIYKSWRIGFLLPWAALLFVAGYILREYGAYHYDNIGVFISSSVLLFCAPPVYAGANYFILGRALYYIPYLSPMHPGRVVSTFIGLDVLVEALSANGAALVANRQNTPARIQTGLDLTKAALLLQLALFGMFCSTIAFFQYRCTKAGIFKANVKIVLVTLYASCCLILTRNVFRTVQFFAGWESSLNSTEPYFWALESVPMIVNTWIMNIWPPAKYLPQSNKIYLARDGVTELEGPGWCDNRPFLLTLFDPFDIGGLITGKDKKTKFWEHDGIEPKAKRSASGEKSGQLFDFV